MPAIPKAKAKAVSAADANRNFSSLLRGVRGGQSYVVTSHGRPVARLVPMGADDHVESNAVAVLFRRLERAPIMQIGSWTRDELYDRR
jgi:prevent-host-death family protein